MDKTAIKIGLVAAMLMFVACIAVIYCSVLLSGKLPDIRVSASRGNSDGKVGELIWTVCGRWERDVVIFYDYRMDGTLDLVSNPKPFIESDSLSWKVWTERYNQIRQEYITGEKPESP